jgi:hypothetical protein
VQFNKPAIGVYPWKHLKSYSITTRWQWATFPVAVFLFTRIALLGVSKIGMTIVPALHYGFGPQILLLKYPSLDGLCRWDCEHFGNIARVGYTTVRSTNFFPLYPMLVHALHALTGLPFQFAMLIVPNLASLGAFLVIYRIFSMLAEEEAARWALALLAAYPFAFFQATGYPESLMMFFSALAILLALRGNHISAGVALGLGVLARHLTLFAGASLLTAQVRQRGLHPKRLLLTPAILGLLVPWLFFGLYCLYQYIKFGNPLAFWSARNTWGSLAWWGIWHLLTTKEHNEHVPIIYSYLPFAYMTTLGALALLTKRQWTELAAFAIGLMFMCWAVGIWGIGRYSASCWPAFLPFGVWLSKRPNLQGPVIAMLAVFQGLFFFLFAHAFPIL